MYNSRRRPGNSGNVDFGKIIKDNIVAVGIGVFVFLVLIYAIFFKGGSSENPSNENREGIAITASSNSVTNITYSNGSKTNVTGETQLYKTEKVSVTDGEVQIVGKGFDANLNTRGELTYLENGNIKLNSSDLFIKSSASQTVEMTFANVILGANSAAFLIQNEAMTSVYLVSGQAEVKTNANVSTFLTPGNQISIGQIDSKNTEADLNPLKKEFDNSFKTSNWFLKNGGQEYLNQIANSSNNSENTETGTTPNNSNALETTLGRGGITLVGLRDEAYVTSRLIDIRGTYTTPNVTKVVINGQDATVDSATNSFELKGFTITQRQTDIVIKLQNGETPLAKDLITIYYDGNDISQNTGTVGTGVVNYPIDSSEFEFIAPSENPYETTTSVVKIEGRIPAGKVAKISVNGYTLKEFRSGGAYWVYFANSAYGNLSEGLNIYEVKYFDSNGNVIHTNAFSIIKKSPVSA